MMAKNLKNCMAFVVGDGTLLRELLHPSRENVDVPYSIAHAKLKPGNESLTHKLKSTEVYYIISGSGILHVGKEARKVAQGSVIHVPANSSQHIKNSGKIDLEFLCVVSPPWKKKTKRLYNRKRC